MMLLHKTVPARGLLRPMGSAASTVTGCLARCKALHCMKLMHRAVLGRVQLPGGHDHRQGLVGGDIECRVSS